ncbi:MAG: MarR family transcriptional regulator [Acetobacteraceae bacterium]|nr:MarR family transcriptional regulator [Acetobacteraceae bacterium]
MSAEHLNILCAATVAMVHADRPDLTARQLAVLLTCYLADEEQTVRGLAAQLKVSKPSISRGLDRMEALDLLRRRRDPRDRRSMLIERTVTGVVVLRDIEIAIARAAAVPGPRSTTLSCAVPLCIE